ncbi:MAG: sugar ABC transporter permease [Chloroflexi bacterium]|nr:MAG: sugar ABC transporter permease [Chloroflexota bacterium]
MSGLNNYQRLFSDPEVGTALINTLIFTIIAVPCAIALSLLIAVLLNQKIRGLTVYRTLYFLPAVTMPAAIAIVWRWLYNGDYGLINYVLGLFSIHGPRWDTDPHIALFALTVVAIWSYVGTNMILFLAGLQGIPKTYYEAAALDGSGPWRTFFRITLPMLSPTIFFASVVSLVTAFQIFDLVYLMFGPSTTGGSSTTNIAILSTETVVYLFYKHAFTLDNQGYAAAIAMLLFVIILIVTAIQFRLQRRWVYYS